MRPAKTLSPPIENEPAFFSVRWRAILLLLAVTLPWWIALTCPMTGIDDPLYVSKNEIVLGGLNPHSMQWAFTTTTGEFWLPLTWLSLLLDATLFGKDAWGFHLTNILLHIANCLLVYELLRIATRAPLRSLLVAILFAIHPLRVESVAWVTERKDVLSAFFGLLALLNYVRYAQAPAAWRFLLACLFYALSLMAKPMLVTLPFLLLLIDYWPLARQRTKKIRNILFEKIPFLALAVTTSIITFLIQKNQGALVGGGANPLPLRLENGFLSLVFYLRDTFYFADLSVYYPRLLTIDSDEAFLAIIIVLAVTALTIWAALEKSAAPVLMGWLWFLLVLLPALGIIQSGGQSRADRFTYFPAIGLFIALVWAWPTNWLASADKRRFRAGLIAAITAVLLISMTVRLLIWRDPLLLYADGAAHTSGNWYLETIMGETYYAQHKFPEALDHYQRALEIVPHAAQAQNSVGIVLYEMGRLPEAAEHFRLAHQASPNDETYARNYNAALENLARHTGTAPAAGKPTQEHP